MPASESSFAVPPVERICTRCFASTFAKSTSPRLSLTLMSARWILGIELLHVDPRHPLADARQHLVRDGFAPAGDLVGGDHRAPLSPDHHRLVARDDPRHAGHAGHDAVHSDP